MIVKTEGKTEKDFLEFGLSFIDFNCRIKDQYQDTWQEVLQNYIVTPQSRYQTYGPYQFDYAASAKTLGATLVDTQTHQMVEAILANAMLTVFRDRGYTRAKRRGPEDTEATIIASKLVEHALGITGHYREQYGVSKSACLYGTGIMHRYWRFDTADMNMRDYQLMGGIELVTDRYSEEEPVFNDVCLTCIELDDFIPDFGHDTCATMYAAGYRFTTSANEAQKMVRKGRWKDSEVNKALEAVEGTTRNVRDSRVDWREGLDKTTDEVTHPAFQPIVGYTIYAETPMLHSDKRRWRELTILNGYLVQNEPFDDHKVPFDELTINPIKGRFYGLAPAEVAIYSQDFATGLLRCIANATARMTNGVWVIDANQEVDQDALKNFRAPVSAESVDAVRELNYNPPVAAAFNMYQLITQMMQTQSGSSSIQGTPGPARESATGANLRVQSAVNRPELFGQLIERDYLPKQANGILGLYKQYINDPEEIIDRIGNVAHIFPLSAIQADYDVSFVGSRQSISNDETANAIERLLQIVLPIPEVAAQFPIIPAIGKWMELRGLEDLAIKIGDPNATQEYIQLNQTLNPGEAAGNGNGTTPALPPAGAPEAQMLGRAGGY